HSRSADMARSLMLLSVVAYAANVATAITAPAAENAASAISDGQKLVADLAARCRPWIAQPSPELKSLKYTYHLRNDERPVELVSGATRARRGMWQATTLYTGLHALLRAPDQYEIKVQPADSAAKNVPSTIELVVRPKNS